MTRKTIIAGNWKMNQTRKEIDVFFNGLKEQNFTPKCETWIAAQTLQLQYIQESARPYSFIKVGAQTVSEHNFGAYTGETAAASLKDMGFSFTLVGHSERRALFNESNEMLNAKIKKALENNLKVVYCVGETLEQREAKQAYNVIQSQLHEGLQGINLNPDNIVIAYEPVWAIGTGKTATPKIAGEIHTFIRGLLKEQGGRAADISLLYGGSVKPSNIDELLKVKDIDGALVGGASLKPADFAALYKAGSK
jgi:triosephosphate isomerase